MGAMINVSMLSKDLLRKATNAIIICSYTNRVARLIKDSQQYMPLNLNIRLAEELMKYPAEERHLRANDEAMSIVFQRKVPTLLEKYEILFDPRYNIDTIKIFTKLALRQKVVVKWCGTLNGNFLEYATPEYKDYHSYRIQDYDITCVI